jgi:hypothetical protein
MKIKHLMAATPLFLSSFILHPSAFPQGSLTPPGPPAPTMKTLDQIEPRTPISSLPFTISASGSYYLTQNLSVSTGNAITINGIAGVTLDLNGFTITSTAATASGTAIALLNGGNDITIKNGHIVSGVTFSGGTYSSGPGFINGIAYAGAVQNVLVSHVTVTGCLHTGLYLPTVSSTAVEFCVVQTVGTYGIQADSVSHSSAYQCGSYGIVATTASDCSGLSTGSGTGLKVQTATNCSGTARGSGSGLSAQTATNCSGNNTGGGTGLDATTASNCTGASTGNGTGVSAILAMNCVGTSTGSGFGVIADVALNCFGSSDSGNGLQFTLIGAMCYGIRGSPNAVGSVLGGGLVGPKVLP